MGQACPGFSSVASVGTPDILGAINATNAHFLEVALAAAKGLTWIQHNLLALNTPVISHLEAVVNFSAQVL